jgi:scytalone dehydratase
MEQEFRKVDGKWRIAAIAPSLLYHTGNFTRVRRPDGED